MESKSPTSSNKPDETEEAQSQSQSQSIWESASDDSLLRHPLLQTAFRLVRENIENCLSGSYAIVADSTEASDHMAVLLTLPGRFELAPMDGIFGQTKSGRGIAFNRGFVEQSTKYVMERLNENESSDEDVISQLHDDYNVITFIAILQETLEHELGHWKFHAEGGEPMIGGNTDLELKVDTPERLRYEAGYGALAQIRKNRFVEESHDGEYKQIELESAVGFGPLRPVFSYIYSDPPKTRADALNQVDSDDYPIVLTKEEILKHMEYPQATTRCSTGKEKRKRGDDDSWKGPPDSEPPKKGDRDDEEPPSQTGRRPRPWQWSIQSFLPWAVSAARRASDKQSSTAAATNSTSGEGQLHSPQNDGTHDLLRFLPDGDNKVTAEKINALKHCEFELVFCDRRSRLEKSLFSRGDQVCLLLLVKNPVDSANPVIVAISRGLFFGRGGLGVEVDGITRGRVHNSVFHRMRLMPGESCTFFRILTKPYKDEEVAYETSALAPGREYQAYVTVFGERLGRPVPFSII